MSAVAVELVEEPIEARAAPEDAVGGGFGWLWTAETISLAGSAVTTVALPALAVLRLGAGPVEVGLLAAAVRLPYPFLGLIAGVIADRLPRRAVMVTCDLARVLVLGSIPVADAAGLLSVPMLIVIAALSGVFGVFFDIANLALVPSLVGRRGLVRAYGWLEVTNATSNLVGPGLGGLLVQLAGAARAVAADAASFLASAVLLLRIRPRATEHDHCEGPRPSPLADLREGVRFVLREPVLRALLLSQGLLVLGAHAIDAPLLLFAYRDLGFSPGTVGLVLTIAGVGSMLGAVASRRLKRWAPGRVTILSSFTVGVCLLALPLAAVAPPLVVLPGLLAIDAAVGTVGNVAQVTLRQSLTPTALQGRMNAFFRVVYWGAWPLANLLGGLLAAVTGPLPAIAIAGAVCVVSAGVGALTPLRVARLLL